MRIKIKGGTARDDEPPLCFTCRHATIVRGRNLHDEIIECGRLSGELSRITFAVKSCSAYDDERNTSLWRLEQVAWVLRTGRGTRKIGFVPARELKPHLRHILDDDDWP